jgi:hypothetical protein
MSAVEGSRPPPSPTPITVRPTEPTDTSSSAKLVAVPFHDVPAAWKGVGPLLEKAIDAGTGEINLRDVFDALVARRMQLWTAIDDNKKTVAAVVTEVQQHPRLRVCSVRLGAGNLDAIIKHIEPLAEWAKWAGCDALELYGRLGWARILKDWTMTHVVLRREL